MLEYNVKRNSLIIKEYGRNVQKMIEKAITIEDYDKRTEAAKAIVRIMSQINPNVQDTGDSRSNQRDSLDYWHKLWDHLIIMSNYKLEINSPFPKPTADRGEMEVDKPDYNKHAIKFRTYGRNMEQIIATVSKYPSYERVEMSKILSNHLKKLYLHYNRDSVEDSLIISHIKELSNGRLSVPDGFELTATKDILRSDPIAKPISKSSKKRRKKKKKDQ